MVVSWVCICVYVSVVSWQAAWGKERPDGYYANEASCLLHWQTPHNCLLVLLEVKKIFHSCFPPRHILSPFLYFLREGIFMYSNFTYTLLCTFHHYSPVSFWLSICTVTVMNAQTGKASLSICWLLQCGVNYSEALNPKLWKTSRSPWTGLMSIPIFHNHNHCCSSRDWSYFWDWSQDHFFKISFLSQGHFTSFHIKRRTFAEVQPSFHMITWNRKPLKLGSRVESCCVNWQAECLWTQWRC